MHNSELGMILPFAFALFVVWSGTKILLARNHARNVAPPDLNARLDALGDRLDRLEQVVETTVTQLQRVEEAEQFTAQLLSGPSRR